MVMIMIFMVMIMEGVVLLVDSHIRKAWLGLSFHHYANISEMLVNSHISMLFMCEGYH